MHFWCHINQNRVAFQSLEECIFNEAMHTTYLQDEIRMGRCPLTQTLHRTPSRSLNRILRQHSRARHMYQTKKLANYGTDNDFLIVQINETHSFPLLWQTSAQVSIQVSEWRSRANGTLFPVNFHHPPFYDYCRRTLMNQFTRSMASPLTRCSSPTRTSVLSQPKILQARFKGQRAFGLQALSSLSGSVLCCLCSTSRRSNADKIHPISPRNDLQTSQLGTHVKKQVYNPEVNVVSK